MEHDVSGGVRLGIPGLERAEVVGRGAFSVVARAWQPAFRREVAVKVLTLTRLDEDAKQRFRRECQAMGALADHPSIVTIYDAGFNDEGRPYLVMAYLPGGSLAERIDSTGGVGWPEAFRIGVRLAGGLETAHRAGILHRDLKPANVLTSPFGEQLTDFGIARIAGALETRTGQISASPAYAAPEILAGHKPTVQSDVYSLGATLFEIITGEPAFVRHTDESLVPLLLRISQDPLPDLRERGVPPDAAAALEWAMAKEIEARPPTALAFGRALQHAQQAHGHRPTPVRVAGEPEFPPAAPPPSVAEQTAPQLQPPPLPPTASERTRRRSLIVIGAIAGLLAAVLVAAAVARSGGSEAEPPPEASPTVPAATRPSRATTTAPAPAVTATPATVPAATTQPPTAVDDVVPDLGLVDDPTAFLEAAGFDVNRSDEYSDDAPYGDVVRQDPPPGSVVRPGSRVDVVLSLGPVAVLAFDSNRDGNTEIYATDAAGGSAARLTRGGARDSGAAWSPDGRLIAFASDRSGGDEIYVMRRDGSEPARLTSTPGINVSPVWSPDGSRLAFASTRDNDLEIYAMDSDGANPRRLTTTDDRDFGPAWSPDGSSIAFGSEREGLAQIFVMRADGTDQRRLTTFPGRNFDPVWSPDGSQLAFVSDRDGDQEIYVMNTDGSGQVNLSASPGTEETSPAWSARGDLVVFVSDRTGDLEIFAAPPGGGEARNLSNNPTADEAAPDWSPVGGPAG